MSSRQKTLGESELDLLRYITERQGATVAEAVEGFGIPRDLTRSTIVTVMERLREKGFLIRHKGDDGVFRYVPAQAQEEVLGGIIDRFIDRTLGGRMTALTAYFARSERLSEAEKTELQRLLKKMEGSDDAL